MFMKILHLYKRKSRKEPKRRPGGRESAPNNTILNLDTYLRSASPLR